jgi:hypothetical protein
MRDALMRRPVERLGPAQPAPSRPFARLGNALRGGTVRAVLTYVGFTAAVTVGQVLATLITNA